MNFLIALIAAISGGTWLYTKFMRRTGNNTKSALVSAGVVSVLIFVVVLTMAFTIDSMLK